MMSNEDKQLNFRKIKMTHWIIFIGYLLVSGYFLYQFILPFKAERYYRDAYRYGALKKFHLAIELMEKAVSYAPWETHYLIQLGKYYEDFARQQNSNRQKIVYFEKAIDVYNRTVELDSRSPWYRNRLATVYKELEAILPEKMDYYHHLVEENIRKAAELDSQNPLFVLNYASFLHQEGRFDDAIPLYLKVIEYDDRIPESYFNMAAIEREKGNYEKALEYYLKLYERDSKFNKIGLAVANSYMVLNRPKEAIPYLEEYVSINKDLETLKVLAGTYYQLNNWREAAKWYGVILTHFQNQDYLTEYFVFSLANSGQAQLGVKVLEDYIQKYPDQDRAKKQLKTLNDFIRKNK